MKNKILIISGIVLLLLASSVFLIYDNRKISFVEDESYNYKSVEVELVCPQPVYRELQPAYFFTAAEFPYGNEGIYVSDNKLVIKTDMDMDDLFIARAAGTGSMLPTIPRKAILIEVPVIKSELIVGDIVSIHQEDYNIVHRIVEITNGSYITKGDNNNVVDPEVWEFEDFDRKVAGVLW